MAEEKKDTVDTEELQENRPEDTAENTGETGPEETGSPEETVEGTVEEPEKEQPKQNGEDEKLNALTDQYRRLMAEFDNYRKRTDKEKAAQYDMGVMKTVEKLLPVLDGFDNGLAAVPEEDRNHPVYIGMDKIYRGLIKTLNDMGVGTIEAVGREFDPNLHNAVLQVENQELQPNTVAQELQKGYTYKGNVLRYSVVSVVKE